MSCSPKGGIQYQTLDSHANQTTWYYFYLGATASSDLSIGSTTLYNMSYYEDLRGLDVQVSMVMTSAPGTNQTMDGRVQYEVLRRGALHS